MKKIIALALVAAFIFSGALSASATEIKAKGEFQFTFGYTANPDLYDNGWDQQSEDGFYASQRTRVQVDFVASEMLRGVLYFEIGTIQWGRSTGPGGGDGGALGADGVNVATKRAYIDFMVPDTDLMFRVGIQGLALPQYIATNPILDDDVAGVAAVLPINDMFGVTAFWARLYDQDANGVLRKNSPEADEMDAWGLILGITGDGWELSPYAMFASVGRNVIAGDPAFSGRVAGSAPASILSPAALLGQQAYVAGATANYLGTPFDYYYDGIIRDDSYYPAWWVGLGGQIDMFDPLVIMFDAAYGSVEASNSIADRAGWYASAEIDYKLDFATLGFMAFYGSGEDGDWSNGSEQLPVVSSGGWGITTFGFDGSTLDNAGNAFSNDPAGKWGLEFLVKDLTFIEDLTSQIRVLFMKGTNDPASRYVVGFPQLTNAIFGYKGNAAAAANLTAMYAAVGYPWAFQGNMNFPGAGVPNIQLTTEDTYWEVNFDHQYMIYENLAAILELGMFDVDYGNDTWVHNDTSTAWKAVFGLKYKF